MTSQVTLPLWLALIIGALAMWAAFERLVLPAVRYLLRRHRNRAIDELNTRLKLRIQPFKLAKRQALIDQLIFDPEVLRAIEEYASANKVSREAAQARARGYAREIVPSFSAYAYFGIGTRLARSVSTFLYRVRLGYLDEAAMQLADPDAAVVFVINHRSNMDYVLVTYMASTSSALSYAVGEWARVWLLQNLIRSMGAYFVRRDSREPRADAEIRIGRERRHDFLGVVARPRLRGLARDLVLRGIVLDRAQHLGIKDELIDQRLAFGKLERLDAQLQPRVELVDRTIEAAAQEPAHCGHDDALERRPDRKRADDQCQPQRQRDLRRHFRTLPARSVARASLIVAGAFIASWAASDAQNL